MRMAAGIACGPLRRRSPGRRDVHAQGGGRTARALPQKLEERCSATPASRASGNVCSRRSTGSNDSSPAPSTLRRAHAPRASRRGPDGAGVHRTRRCAGQAGADARMARLHCCAGQRNPNLLELLESGLKPRELAGAFARLRSRRGDVRMPSPSTLPPLEPVWRALDALLGQLQPLLPNPIDDATTCKAQQCARLYPRTRKGARRHRAADLAQLLHDWERGKKITQNRWGTHVGCKGNVVAAGEGAGRAVRDRCVEPFLVEWRAHLYALSSGPLMRGARSLRTRPAAPQLANYGDLLTGGRPPAARGARVRAALQEKFTHLFVDEFQDTDPVQAELFLWRVASAHCCDLESGATVGVDVSLAPRCAVHRRRSEQSIFRFRRADIVVYESVRQRLLATGGEVVSLTANFRSRPALCDSTNTVFPPLLCRFIGSCTRRHSSARSRPPRARCQARAARGDADWSAKIAKDAAAALAEAAPHRRLCPYGSDEPGRRAYGDFLMHHRHEAPARVPGGGLRRPWHSDGGSGAALFNMSPARPQSLAALAQGAGRPARRRGARRRASGPLYG